MTTVMLLGSPSTPACRWDLYTTARPRNSPSCDIRDPLRQRPNPLTTLEQSLAFIKWAAERLGSSLTTQPTRPLERRKEFLRGPKGLPLLVTSSEALARPT